MRSIYAKDYQDVPRPVAAMPREYVPGYIGVPHSHPRGQLLHAVSGTMVVMAEGGSWLVPPHRALWIPPGITHEVHCRGAVSLRTAYVAATACRDVGATCRALDVSPLLAALLVEATRVPLEYDLSGRDARLMQLLLDEIGRMETLALHVPMPRSEALLAFCRRLMRQPGLELTLEDGVLRTGIARRSFTRRFREETGLSFAQWRTQLRLREALARLSEGVAVTEVALDVGYDSPSAFTAAFRRAFNTTPSAISAQARLRADG